MTPALPLTSLVSAYAGAKARQLRRDAVLIGFVCLMAVLASAALLGAFAVFVAESHGLIAGMLAAAALALGLGIIAIGIRAVLRRLARRRMASVLARNASALAVTSASTVIAQNKTTAIVAGLLIGAFAGSMARSGRH